MAIRIQIADLSTIPVELQLLIGQNLGSPSLLRLCQTCRQFYRVFKPSLYRRVYLSTAQEEEGNLFFGLDALAVMDVELKASCLKELVIETPMLCDLPSSNDRSRRENRSYYNRLLRSALEHCSALEKLEYAVGETKQNTLDTMKRLSALRHFDYTFVGEHHRNWPEVDWVADSADENEIADKEDDFSFRPISLVGFRNLSSLRLFELYPCLSSFQREIVQILLECPSLSDLALSVMARPHGLRMATAVEVCDNRHHPDDDPSHINFWEQICVTYASQAKAHCGGCRLEIESLHLGSGIYLEAFTDCADDTAEDNYMTRAFDLSALRTFRFDNVPANGIDVVFDHIAFDERWDYLDTATNLVSIRAETIRPALLGFLSSPRRKEGQQLRRLAIGFAPSEDYPLEDRELLKEILATEAVEKAEVVFGDFQGNLPGESTFHKRYKQCK